MADLDADPRLGAAVTKYCSAIVPVYELKWGTLRPQRDVFDFEKADRLSQFARDNQLSMRGHCLVWYYGLPDWTREIATPAEAERELVKHIETVVSHYRGRLTSWDVLNEPIPDKVAGPTDRRECFWSRFLGQRYIDVAYRAAAAADPDARLSPPSPLFPFSTIFPPPRPPSPSTNTTSSSSSRIRSRSSARRFAA